MYLTLTRPILALSIQVLNQLMEDPRDGHLRDAYKVLKYLKATLGQGSFYPSMFDLKLKAYSDSDWAGISDRVLLGSSLIT